LESNWRFNVWRLGLPYSGIKLITRILTLSPIFFGPTPYYVTDAPAPSGTYARYLEPAALGQFPTFDSFQTKGSPNFPYGNLTNPDHGLELWP